MSVHITPPANVVRFPVRLRVVPPILALDALLSAGTIDDRQHAAGLAYAALRRRFNRAGGRVGYPDDVWATLKRDHAALIRAAGAERFMLDRLCLDDEEPLRCEVERVRAALGRMVKLV